MLMGGMVGNEALCLFSVRMGSRTQCRFPLGGAATATLPGFWG
jgi:hypothetical protein